MPILQGSIVCNKGFLYVFVGILLFEYLHLLEYARYA